MRGDQLARQRPVNQTFEARPYELTMAEAVRPERVQETARERTPSKAYSNRNWDRLFCYGPGLIGEAKRLKAFKYGPS